MKYLLCCEGFAETDEEQTPRRMFAELSEAREWVKQNKKEIHEATLYRLTKRGYFMRVDYWDYQEWASERKKRPLTDAERSADAMHEINERITQTMLNELKTFSISTWVPSLLFQKPDEDDVLSAEFIDG